MGYPFAFLFGDSTPECVASVKMFTVLGCDLHEESPAWIQISNTYNGRTHDLCYAVLPAGQTCQGKCSLC